MDKKKTGTHITKRIYTDTNSVLTNLKTKINSKMGSIEPTIKINDAQIIDYLVKKMSEEDIKTLWSKRLTEADKVNLDLLEYNKKNKTKLSYEEYLGVLRANFKKDKELLELHKSTN